LPTQIDPAELVGGVAVVIDVLRASTTIVTALANGAASVIPCADVEMARRIAAEGPAGTVLSGGERGGVRIEGFDLDNSPASYPRSLVEAKTIAFTTTNGTAALFWARNAARLLIGSLVNRRAVVEAVWRDRRPVHLVCAGGEGPGPLEDELGAGAIATGISELCEIATPDAALQRAIDRWKTEASSPARLEQAMHQSAGGRNLHRVGFDADVGRAAQVDSIDLVPEYVADTGRIEAVGKLGLGDRESFR
jgi:2-phosphosulfolactate phosphatase